MLLRCALLLCLLAPVFYTLNPPHYPILAVGVLVVVYLGVTIYVEWPLAWPSLPNWGAALTLASAIAYSLSGTPQPVEADGTAILSVLGYLLFWSQLLRSGTERVQEICAGFQGSALTSKLAMLEEDHKIGILDAEDLPPKQAYLRKESAFFANFARASELVIWQPLGAAALFVLYGMQNHQILWMNMGVIFLLSTSIGMVLARTTADHNLD